MIKKGLALMLTMVMAAGTLAACGTKNTDNSGNTKNDSNVSEDNDKSTSPQELTWNLGSDPKYLDPGLNSASDGGDVINNLFEGLVRDVDGKYVPGIAESWDISDDGLVYTFHLRKSNWSDGTPLTAKDYEYAWKRVLSPDTKSEYSFIMFPILNAKEYNEGAEGVTADDLGVKAVDELTLEVTLKSPTEYFLGVTQFYTYFPVKQEAAESKEDGLWAKKADSFVGNGPFKLVKYTEGDRIEMVKNENYWNKDAVKLDKITALMIVESSTAYTAYENNEIQVIDDVPNEEIPRLMAEDPEFYLVPMTGTYYYIFNMNIDAFKDVKVRKALSLAIDRKKITENVLKGGQIPATGFVPSGIQDAEGKDFRTVNGDLGVAVDSSKIEEAKKLLAEAGYANGEGFPEFTLKYNTSEAHKKVAEAVQAMWKENLGIHVKLTNAEWAVFQTQRSNGDFDIARGGWIGDYSDPNTMLDLFVIGGSHNDPQWQNEEYSKLIEEASQLTGQERMNKFYKAEQILLEEMPIFPIYYYSDFFMIKDSVQGVEKTRLNTFYFGNGIIK